MAYDAKHRKVYNHSAEFMSQSASEIIKGLGGTESKQSNPTKGRLDANFNKKIKGEYINNRVQLQIKIDAQSTELSAQADGLHPAVLRLIDKTVQAAHTAGKWVGVCGELGADPQAVPILVGLGVDELSVSIPAIPAVKAQIRSLSLSTAKRLAAEALECASATEVRRTVDSLSLRTFSKANESQG